ncbi:hypothetical protein D3C75_1218240 [compost metagenome]
MLSAEINNLFGMNNTYAVLMRNLQGHPALLPLALSEQPGFEQDMHTGLYKQAVRRQLGQDRLQLPAVPGPGCPQ